MAYDLTTTDGINSYMTDWTASQTKKKIDPLTAKQTKWTKLQSAYTTIGNKLSSLRSIAYSLSKTGTSSAFLVKKASSSDSTFADITATSAAALSSQSIRINQIAKNDLVISQDLTATADSTAITTPGTHTFTVTAGDGKGGVIKSDVEVTFEASDFTDGKISNKDVITKIQSAINADKAIVLSGTVTGDTLSAGTFKLNLNDTTTEITYEAGTYSDVLDSIISQINAVSGVNAEKVVDGSNYSLKITVTSSSKYMSLNGDTGGLLTELGISNDQVMGASGLLTASVFAPTTDLSQLSIAAKKSGNDYRLLSLTDTSGQALSSLGLNLGGSRTTYVQSESGADTPGFVYATSLLNAKITFNGINVERNSNSISDLITGATIKLKSLMQTSDTTVTLDIASDTSTVIEKIQDFVAKFNDIYVYLKENTKAATATKDSTDSTSTTTTELERGLLRGDSSATSLLSLLTNISTTSVAGLNTDDLNSLSRLGITFSVSEGLSVSDADALEKAVKETPDQVESIFNSTNGIATALYARIDPYINATGYLYKAKQNFDTSINYLDDKIKSTQEKIDKNASALRLRYLKTSVQMKAILSSQSTFIMGSGFYSNG
jgi:flagellar hook-associated protein 2